MRTQGYDGLALEECYQPSYGPGGKRGDGSPLALFSDLGGERYACEQRRNRREAHLRRHNKVITKREQEEK